jgi:FixJ family two-component response regulator
MQRESLTVYVVDDDGSVRRALERLLRSAGYRVHTFDSAENFLGVTSGRVDGCLVLDIRLPGMTGLDLQESLADRGVNCKVIFITAHDNPSWRERADRLGAVAYLTKPFGEVSLLNAIRSVTDEETEKI